MAFDWDDRAARLIREGRLPEAKQLLLEGLARQPADWSAELVVGDTTRIAFWDSAEFEAYCAWHEQRGALGSISWGPLGPSYSMALYLLACIAVEEKDAEQALVLIEQGLSLERDHPLLHCEKGYILNHAKRPREALDAYLVAERKRPWVTHAQKARALRGQGFALIDIGRLDEAEDALRRSLQAEPGNAVALGELKYIAELRRQ